MSTTPNVPYRLEFGVEVPGIPGAALASHRHRHEMEERESDSLHFTMGPEMGSDGQATAWEPPRRLVYEEDWAPHGQGPRCAQAADVRARPRGTVRRNLHRARHQQRLRTGAAWESEFWDTMGPGWMPFFDNLRLPVALPRPGGHTPGGHRIPRRRRGGALVNPARRARASRRGRDGRGAWRHRHGRARRRAAALVRLTAPVPGILSFFAWAEGDRNATPGRTGDLFSAYAADFVRREERAWLQRISVPA